MAALQPVRGTKDLLPDDARRHRYVEETALRTAALYGFGEIVTPIFEFTDVFARTLGESSDVVTKEMYSFADRNNESLTLRPEGTAGVARAFISHGLTQALPLKFSYRGPMFRYERPQKGRQRQFHQVGVELLGVERALADIEVIAVGAQYLDALGIGDDVTLELNTLGDADSRNAYRSVLVAYLMAHKDRLSQDSLDRLDRNPMRILDSKDEGDKAIVVGAPAMADSLSDAARAFFDQVVDGLEKIGIAYRLNSKLVRGLDYYCHTAFEFTTETLGAQGTVLAGGRYDGLVSQMGGPKTPGVGWAAGVERLAMMVTDGQSPAAVRPLTVIPVGAEAEAEALVQTQSLRRAGFTVDLGYSGNLGKRMKRANKANARVAIIIGSDELARGAATVRDLDSGDQTDVALGDLATFLAVLTAA